MTRRIDDVTLAERLRRARPRRLRAEVALHLDRRARAGRRARRAGHRRRSGRSPSTRAVGGLNPLAVEIAAREGARIVWLPTVDAVNEADARDREYPEGVAKPFWARHPARAARAGHRAPSRSRWSTRAARRCPSCSQVLARDRAPRARARDRPPRARRDLRGRRRRGRGGRRARRRHAPRVPVRRISTIADQVELADRGALLERCFTTPLHAASAVGARVRRASARRASSTTLLSTDLGQPANPPVEDGLALFADRLLEAGFYGRRDP